MFIKVNVRNADNSPIEEVRLNVHHITDYWQSNKDGVVFVNHNGRTLRAITTIGALDSMLVG